MIEFDFGFDAQAARMRPQFAVAAIAIDPHRLEHLDVAPRRRRRHAAGPVDRLDKGQGAAIHDRDFRPVDFDDRIVDAEAVEGGKHVFGGGNGGTVFVAEHGGEFGRGHGAEIGGKFAIFLAVGAAAYKDDAGVSFGWIKCDGNGPAGMNADTGNGHWLAQRCLPASLHAPRHALHLIAKLPSNRPTPPLRSAKVSYKGVSRHPARPPIPHPNANSPTTT